MSEPLQILEDARAVLKGHFLLASGLHSDTYVQKFRIFQHPEVAEDLARRLATQWTGVRIDTVAAPAVGAIVFGHEMARALHTRSVFLERKDGVFATRIGMELVPGEKVLCAEDVVTTGGSVLEMARAVEAAGAEVVGFAALLDRTGGKNPFDKRYRFEALIRMSPAQFPAEDCPWCKAGLPLTKPGTKQGAKT